MKNLAFATLLVLLFSSCKKDNNNSNQSAEYYVKFSLNSTKKLYTKNTMWARTDQGASTIIIELFASQDADMTKNSIDLLVSTQGEFVIDSTYSSNNNTISGGLVPVQGDYYNDFGDDYNTVGATRQESTLRFTKITDKYIKGTFSCPLYFSSSDTPDFRITDGEFYLPRK